MYLAYLNVTTKDGDVVFAIYGKDSEEIRIKSLKLGSDPYFVAGMYKLGKDWG